MVVVSRFVAVAVLLGLCADCGVADKPESHRETIRDLIATLDVALIQKEPGVVDAGTPAARVALRRGWAPDEAQGGRTVVWSDGPESELTFFLAAPRDLPLELKGTPFVDAKAPPQEITLVLNGETVGRISADQARAAAKVVLPKRALVAGANFLVLRYAWTRPHWPGSRRRSAMAWDHFRFGTGIDERSEVRAAGEQLSIPFGSRVSFYQRLPPKTVLAFDGLRDRGGPSGELRVVWRVEGGKDQEVARLRPHQGPAIVALPNGGAKPVRLALDSVPDRPGASAGGGVVLRRPVLARDAGTAENPGIVEIAAAGEPAPPPKRPRFRRRTASSRGDSRASSCTASR